VIALLESRRSEEVARLIQRQGGRPYVAPALREVPVEDDAPVNRWLDALAEARFHTVLFLTGVGCRMLLEHARRRGQLEAALVGLAAARVVARGPKPVQVLKEHAVRIDFVPPEPNTSDEILAEMARWDLRGKALGLQLYGGVTPCLERLRAGLALVGAQVHEVLPYRWEGPADQRSVAALIDACLDGQVDALAIFSSSQIHNLFAVADEHGQVAALQLALNDPRLLVASVGPVSTQAIESHGVRVGVQPEHPKMGHVVMALAAALGPRPSTSR
jgi:uroporphyrinogen-III synthase